MSKNVLKISRQSGRIPLLLMVSEVAIFVAAVLIAAFLGFGGGGLNVESPVLLLQAALFAAVMMFCMLLLGLYRGRPSEGVTLGFLRLGLALALGVAVLQGLFYLVPGIGIALNSLILAAVLAFFFLGTIRPVFFDTVLSRRGRRQAAAAAESDAAELPKVTNTGEQSLTGQHRTSGRWL